MFELKQKARIILLSLLFVTSRISSNVTYLPTPSARIVCMFHIKRGAWLKLFQKSIREITMKWQQQTESLTWHTARSNGINVHNTEKKEWGTLRHGSSPGIIIISFYRCDHSYNVGLVLVKNISLNFSNPTQKKNIFFKHSIIKCYMLSL